MDTNRHFELNARKDPYWTVLTEPKYTSEQFDKKSKEAFFKTGYDYIEDIHNIIKYQVDPKFTPINVLDFGCGVGRLLLPFAKKGYKVTGLDISDTMLKICAANLYDNNINDFTLLKNDDMLSKVREKFDLVHSYITLQHIPIRRGLISISRLLDSISESGIGVLHFTYSATTIGSKTKQVKHNIKIKLVDFILKYDLLKKFVERIGKNEIQPPILMHSYPVNLVLGEIQEKGFNNIHIRFSNHGLNGILIFCQRNSNIPHPNSF